jgi:DNA repair protein RadC
MDKKEKPHYAGHRDRLRQRFLKSGPDALADYEMLELVLFMAVPRRDIKPLAKELLEKFGNFACVLNAPLPELRAAGLSESAAIALKAVQSSAHRLLKQEVMHKPVLSTWQRLVEYCHATMAHEKKESFRILFLNKKNELIADEVHQTGTIDHTPAYPREIMKRALDVGATALILVHNHPSGDPTPSQSDVDMTYAIQGAGKPFDIIIHDHIIVSRNGITSFKSRGLL